MKQDKRVIMSVIWLLLGGTLVALSFAGKVDEYWNGMGSALLIIGAIQLLRYYRLRTNAAYREKMEIAVTDERNHFIRNKAWAWSGYLFVLVTAVLSIVFKLVGQELLSIASGFAVCLMLILYWVSYMIIRKKY